MGDLFECITEAVREVVGRVYFPPVACPVVVVLLNDAVRREVPHLWISLIRICQALFHSQVCLSGLVFAIAHGSEFGKGLFDWSRAVLAAITSATVVRPTTLAVDFLSYIDGQKSDTHSRTGYLLEQWHTYALSRFTSSSANSYRRSK